MKTIICPNYLKNIYLEKILTNNSTTFDTKILPFEGYVYSNHNNPNVYFEIQAKKLLSKLDLKIFKPMIQYPLFINEMVNFAKLLVLYNYDVTNLPTDNDQEIELKKIMTSLIQLPFDEYQKREVGFNTEDVTCLDFFTNSLFDYELKSRFHNIIKIVDDITPKNSLHYALNMRQEIEAVAQDIVSKKNAHLTNIILSDYNNQLPVLKQIFNRYHIPFSLTHDNARPLLIDKFVTLARFIQFPNIENLLNCLYLKIFKIPCDIDILNYITSYIHNLDMLFNPIDYDLITTINKLDINALKNIQHKTNTFVEKLKPILDELLAHNSLQDILTNTYYYLYDDADIATLNALSTLLNNSLNFIDDEIDLEIVLANITNIKISENDYLTNSVIVTSLDRPVFTREYSYVLGCTSKNYPAFASYNNIFDELYIAKLNIIKQSDRYNLYTSQLDWIFHSGNKITFSYYTNDYANKVFELALEIEELKLKATKWPLVTNDNPIFKNPTLKSTSLFFDDKKVLHGSVSAFERYFSCPFAYFIQYGLKVRKNDLPTIQSNTIGTIMHAVLEELTSKYGKEYVNKTISDFKQITDQHFKDLSILYPNKIEQLEAIHKRLLENLENSFVFLKDMELHTPFKPTLFEYRFEDKYPNIKHPISIKGFIDRYDEHLNNFRIIDYKSSSKKLEEKMIRAGLQMQLLTYVIMASEIFNKRETGAYYYSLKNDKQKGYAYKLSRNKLTQKTEEEYHNDFIASHRLVGVTLDENIIVDDDDNHIISNSKISLPFAKECLSYLYDYLYKQLQKGAIEIAPSESACMYCDYHSICLNRKEPENRLIYTEGMEE